MSEKEKKSKSKTARSTSIGGQAVIEGVMMMGPSARALAVRSPDGEILIETVKTAPKYKKIRKIPILRGIVNFGSTLVTGMKTIMRSAEVAGADEEEELSKGSLSVAVLLGVVLAVGLFIGLPLLISSLMRDNIPIMKENLLIRGLIEGGVRLAIFIGYLALTTLLKDIRRTYMYHGAEHKTINCYEKGLPLTVENVRVSSKVHSRCGTTFLFFVVVISIVIFTLTNWLLTLIPFESGFSLDTWYFNFIIRILLLPLVAGISYELLKFLALLPDNWFTYIFKAPGLALQALTTRQPDDGMIEVAIAAFNAAAEAEPATFDREFKPLLQKINAMLTEKGYEEAEADWIACEVLDRKRSGLAEIETVTYPQYRRILAFAEKRAETGLPLDYVLKSKEFYGFKIALDTNVLIPRPETELLAERAIEFADTLINPEILDLCTGSGCIALAVAKSVSKCRVDASDISPAALAVAKINLRKIPNIRDIYLTDLFEEIKRRYDIIVSNPPYIAEGELESLQPEVKKEPLRALLSGETGLETLQKIISGAPVMLKNGGRLFLEVGANQAEKVKALMNADFEDISVYKDYNGIDRTVSGRKKC